MEMFISYRRVCVARFVSSVKQRGAAVFVFLVIFTDFFCSHLKNTLCGNTEDFIAQSHPELPT